MSKTIGAITNFIFGKQREEDKLMPPTGEEYESTEAMNSILAAQSGGEPVRKAGYMEKRGIVYSFQFQYC